MLTLTTPEKLSEPEREPLFSIDGVEVTVPKGNFDAAFALRYLDVADKLGLDSATVWLFENGLSEGGWSLLMNYAALEQEHVSQISDVLRAKVTGALDTGPKGRRLQSA